MSETNDRPGLGAPAHWMSVQAKDLVTNQQVIQVDSSASIEEACDALIAHKIQSVPLYDSASKSYIGMFDLHDLASYLLAKRPQGRQGLAREVGQQGVEVSRLTDMSHMNPFYSVLPETTVAQIVGVFASGTHRVAVMQSEREIRGILSQTRVVRYFFEHCAGPQATDPQAMRINGLLDRTLQDLGLVTGNVVMAKPTTPVLQALSLLERWHISSVAIVEDSQRLVGNLSVTDIKYVVKNKQLLNGTCIELIQSVRYMQGLQDGRDRAAVFSVRPEASLRYALSKLIATGAHRVWVTRPSAGSDAGELPAQARQRSGSTASARRASISSSSSQTVPIAPPHFAGAFTDTVCGVVSLTDILRLLIEHSPQPAADPEYNYASMD